MSETKEIIQLSPVVENAQSLVISNATELLSATSILSQLNRMADKLEADRLKITKPLNDSLREINARYKSPKETLQGAIAEIRTKMSQYQSIAIKARQEAELKLLERVKEGKGNLKLETAIRKLDEVGAVDKSVDSGDGIVSFTEVEKFEVVDVSTLPKEYLLANEVLIRASMKEGKHVEGVRYYTEQQVNNRRNAR